MIASPAAPAIRPTDKAARVAGAWYFALGPLVPFSLLYIPRALIVRGDATATSAKVLAHESLFRFGIAADLSSAIVLIYLALALYRLLRGVNRTRAEQMVALVLVGAAVGFLNVLNKIAALLLFRGADFLTVFAKPQRDALGMLFLDLHRHGLTITGIFWGLWLLPLGLLVMKSGFIPKILGILLILNCCAYLAVSFTALLWPSYASLVGRVTTPALAGELWISLWLIFKGAGTAAFDGADSGLPERIGEA
jgi:hypothetical protein